MWRGLMAAGLALFRPDEAFAAPGVVSAASLALDLAGDLAVSPLIGRQEDQSREAWDARARDEHGKKLVRGAYSGGVSDRVGTLGEDDSAEVQASTLAYLASQAQATALCRGDCPGAGTSSGAFSGSSADAGSGENGAVDHAFSGGSGSSGSDDERGGHSDDGGHGDADGTGGGAHNRKGRDGALGVEGQGSRQGKEVEMGAGVQTLVEELMEADLVQELLLDLPATQQMLMAVPLGLQMATVATAGMVVMGMTIQVRMVIEEMMAHPQVTLMEEEKLIQIAIRAVMLGCWWRRRWRRQGFERERKGNGGRGANTGGGANGGGFGAGAPVGSASNTANADGSSSGTSNGNSGDERGW